MAKKAESPPADGFTTRKWVYVGPVYNLGILLPGRPSRTPLRPAEFSDKEVEAFIADRPEYAEWWALAEYTTEN